MGIRQNETATSEGNFSKKPFAHILIFLSGKKMGGTLEIEDGENSATIYFQDGMPAKAQTSIKSRGLGQILQLLKLITTEQFKSCEDEIARTGGLQGEVLIRQGAIDTDVLIRGLREQLLLKLTDVFAMTHANYAFYEKVNHLRGFGPDELFPLSVYPLLMSGFRSYCSRLKLSSVKERLAGSWVSIDSGKTVRQFRLSRSEKEVCRDLLTTPQKYDDFVSGDKHDTEVVQYVLYALLLTQLLQISKSQPVEDRSVSQIRQLDSVAPPPPSGLEDSPEITHRKRYIREKAKMIASQNYFEMLDVAVDSRPDEARKAFLKMAKEFHPDRVPAAIGVELRQTLQYIFSNLSEAHTILIDPAAREEYETTIRSALNRTTNAPPPNDESEVRDALNAETMFQKSLVFMRRGDVDKALQFIDEARLLNHGEGEYNAVWAHLRGMKRDRKANVEDLVELLRQSAEKCPHSERVLSFLAQMLKRAGINSEARTYYRLVLELNPRNIQAARELRLMEMRGEAAPKKEKGFFKRLFK
jgi:curved DNA-binding protein CbpA